MKNFKFISLCSLMVFASLFILSSCQKESIEKEAEEIEVVEEQIESPITYPEIPESIVRKVKRLGFNTNDIGYEEVRMTDESIVPHYFLEGDIIMSENQMDDMLAKGFSTDMDERQYRSDFVVTGLPRTINVRAVTIGADALSLRQRQGLSFAVANFNALPIGITLNLSFGAPIPTFFPFFTSNINVRSQNFGGGGPLGIAGFPSVFGNPFNLVRVNRHSSVVNMSNQRWEHVMTHELGHCLGLRHTDWFNRISCGGGGPESPAFWIPGTPIGNDPTSVMNACVPFVTNGEFNINDRAALNTIY